MVVKCSASVPGDSWGRRFGCRKNATVERAGKPYCGTHDPEKVAAKNAAADAKYKAQRAHEDATAELGRAITAVLKALLSTYQPAAEDVEAFRAAAAWECKLADAVVGLDGVPKGYDGIFWRHCRVDGRQLEGAADGVNPELFRQAVDQLERGDGFVSVPAGSATEMAEPAEPPIDCDYCRWRRENRAKAAREAQG